MKRDRQKRDSNAWSQSEKEKTTRVLDRVLQVRVCVCVRASQSPPAIDQTQRLPFADCLESHP